MRKKKIMAIIVLALSLALMLTGCGGKETLIQSDVSLSGVNEFPIVEEPITLSIFTVKSPYVEDYVDNEFTRFLEEKTNVHLEWDVATGDTQQSFNLMMASGQYCDMIMSMQFTKAGVVDYASQGLFTNMEPYIEKHGYYIKQMFEKAPEVREGITLLDGIYALPKVSQGYRYQYPNKMWVYKPWLDKLGIEIPETTEEFYQMLKAFKEKDPNGNGIADEIPLVGRGVTGDYGIESFLMSAFMPTHFTQVYVDKDEKVQFAPVQPEYREGLRYLKKLYDEGLLYADTFTMDRARIMSIGENEPTILGAAPGMFPGMFSISNGSSDRYYEYTAIPPIEGPNGVRTTATVPTAYLGDFVISSSCQYPDIAVKWVDWFYSNEGRRMSQSKGGVANERREAKEGELGYDGKQAKWAVDKAESTESNGANMAHRHSWQNVGVSFSSFEESISVCNYNDVLDPHGEWYKAYEAYGKYEDTSYLGDLIVPSELIGEFNDLKTAMGEARVNFVNFVNGTLSIDDDWDNYIDELKKFGLDRYLEICQISYDTYMKK